MIGFALVLLAMLLSLTLVVFTLSLFWNLKENIIAAIFIVFLALICFYVAGVL